MLDDYAAAWPILRERVDVGQNFVWSWFGMHRCPKWAFIQSFKRRCLCVLDQLPVDSKTSFNHVDIDNGSSGSLWTWWFLGATVLMAKIYGKGGARLRHIPHVFEAVGLSYIVRLSRDRGALCYLSGSGADEPRFPYRWICAVFFFLGGVVLWRSSLKNFLVDTRSRYFFLSLDKPLPQVLLHPTARRFWATTALLVRSGAHSHLLVDSSLRIFRWYFHGMSSSCPHSEITYTKRNMLLEPMGLKQDTLFWILALCKNIFGYHRMLGLLARLFINSFVMPNLFYYFMGMLHPTIFFIFQSWRKWRIGSTRPHCTMHLRAGDTPSKSARRRALQQRQTSFQMIQVCSGATTIILKCHVVHTLPHREIQSPFASQAVTGCIARSNAQMIDHQDPTLYAVAIVVCGLETSNVNTQLTSQMVMLRLSQLFGLRMGHNRPS